MIDRIIDGAREYRIEFDADAIAELFDEVGEEGRTLQATVQHEPVYRILIHPLLTASPIGAFQTLVHEMLHIAERRAGTDIPEDTLDALALSLADMLVQSRLVNLKHLGWGNAEG